MRRLLALLLLLMAACTESVPASDAYECLTVGELTITSASTHAAAAGVCSVVGDLRVELPGAAVSLPSLRLVGGSVLVDAASLELPELEVIGGDLFLDYVEEFEAPYLFRVAGSVRMTDSAIDDLTMPYLTEVEEIDISMWLGSNLALPRLSRVEQLSITIARNLSALDLSSDQLDADRITLDRLASLGSLELNADHLGDLYVNDVPGLERLSLPLLESIHNLTLSLPRAGTAVSAPLLSSALSVNLSGSRVTTLDLPALESVSEAISIVSNPGLVSVQVDELRHVGGDLLVRDNPSLVAVDAPRLDTVVGRLTLTANADGIESLALGSLCRVDEFEVHSPGACALLQQVDACTSIDDDAHVEAVPACPNP